MILNQTAEYALRAMSVLALEHEVGPLTSRELARKTRIPSHYLSKIMRRLVRAGLVHSQRGHGGGFQLALPLEEIQFIDILEAIDYRADIGQCAFGMGSCDPLQPCPLHKSWSQIVQEFEAWARAQSLQSIITQHQSR